MFGKRVANNRALLTTRVTHTDAAATFPGDEDFPRIYPKGFSVFENPSVTGKVLRVHTRAPAACVL